MVMGDSQVFEIGKRSRKVYEIKSESTSDKQFEGALIRAEADNKSFLFVAYKDSRAIMIKEGHTYCDLKVAQR